MHAKKDGETQQFQVYADDYSSDLDALKAHIQDGWRPQAIVDRETQA